jgi:hypothetical protein
VKHASHRSPPIHRRFSTELHGEYEFCCSLLKLAGFQVYRMSQARASNQDAGIPDLWAFHRTRPLEVTVEVKRPAVQGEHEAGRTSPSQRDFAEHRARCRGPLSHITGPRDVLWAWLEFEGLALMLPSGEWAVKAPGGQAVTVGG